MKRNGVTMIVLEKIKMENLKRLASCNKRDSEGAIMTQALELGLELPNTCGGAIALGLEGLENEYKNGELVKKIKLKSNKKLGEIPTINMPNIFVQSTFMRLVKSNPGLRKKYKVVRILMEYFEEHKVCHNCQYCNGLCYNNKFEYGKKHKAISELRVLLAYILEREALANKIIRASKFFNTFRINSNGEIHSEEMLTFWINIAKRKKDTNFYTYTKSYELFEEYLATSKLPKNMNVNMSMIDGQQKDLAKFEKLFAGNKFVIVNEIPDGAKHVCCGDCTECNNLCMRKLPKNNNTIYVAYHN